MRAARRVAIGNDGGGDDPTGTRRSVGPVGSECAGKGTRGDPRGRTALCGDGAARQKAATRRRRAGAHPGLPAKFPGEIAMVPDFLTIAEAARLIEKKELSPVELTQ